MDRAIEGGRDKAAEQGMRLVGAALEFGVELRADEPGWLFDSTISTSVPSGERPARRMPASVKSSRKSLLNS